MLAAATTTTTDVAAASYGDSTQIDKKFRAPFL